MPISETSSTQANGGDQPTAGEVALRVFFVDKETGNPVPGLLVRVFADPLSATNAQKATPSGSQRQPLATLQTDQAGYVSFKFDSRSLGDSSSLTVTYGTGRGDPLVVSVADALAGNDTRTLLLDVSAEANVAAHLGLPSIISPDIKDVTVSPGSIGNIPHLLPGSGLCKQLLPTTMGVRRFEAFLVKANICVPETLKCASDVQIVRGKMLDYEIAWHSLGTALGDLLNTISLAPCEQVNLAVSDWMRQETASQTQAIDVQQQSFQEMNHERLITEAMQSSITTKGSAWGVAGATSAKASPIWDGIKFDFTGALSGGYSSSSGTQIAAVNTSNQLSERITQAASFVASERSTVVFQATASEQQTYQTRTVRNHNHCHTLTLMYYQVNRNYRVVTDYKGERDVILVKYDNADFDAASAYCNAELLKDALLDQSLFSCFDDLADALFCCEADSSASGSLSGKLMDSVTIEVKPGEVMNVSGIIIQIYSASSQTPLSQITTPLSPIWQVGGDQKQTFILPTPIDPQQVAWITVRVTGPTLPLQPPGATVNELNITGHIVNDGDCQLYYSNLRTDFLPEMRTTVQPELTGQQSQSTFNGTDCVSNSCSIQKLLGHLNCHKRYYNAILWMNEDPNERVMRWSCCRGRDKEPLSLIAQIENDPLTVYGDFVVFPAAGSQLVDNPLVLPISKLVTMPTPGVFSEGILGQCNTCEKIDPDRFWDWTKSPCPDSAPVIPPLATPQTGAQPGDLKADTISNLITLSSVPGAPDSIMKDLIAGLVSKADDGSAEAKDLLGDLLDAVKGAIQAAPAPKT